MVNNLFIIFTDFDGVFARVQTWGNDSLFRTKCAKIGCIAMGDLDIYALNRIDRLFRPLKNMDVWLVSTSTWKQVFDKAKNRAFIEKWAGMKKIKIVKKNRHSLDRINRWEPYTRISLIKYYLKKYKPTGYLVLDDQYESAMRDEFGEHFMHTNECNGLSFDDYVAIRSLVSSMLPKTVTEEDERAFNALLAGVF